MANKVVTWESHLIERAVAGEAVAYEILADMHRPALFHLALRTLRNPDDANDAVQEALMKGFRAIGEFQSDRPIRPWLCRICANCCVDAVRNRKKVGSSLDQHEYALADDSQDLEEQASGNYRQHAVREAVERLPKKYRDIILMRHFNHMDVNEIAVALNKPEGTIKSWLFRARAMLRRDLQVALS
jgi:RNA polymerase sigma-70 factor (ECF subfamily)